MTDTYIEKDSSGQRRRRAAAALRHVEPAVAARHGGGGRLGVVHLRSGHAAVLPGPLDRARGRSPRRTATHCCACWSTSNTPATTCPSPAAAFLAAGDTVEIIPAYEELAVRIEFFGDEVEKLYYPASAHRRRGPQGGHGADLPGERTMSRGRADGARGPRHRSRTRAAAGRAGTAEQTIGGTAAAVRDRVRPGDDPIQVGFLLPGIENYSRHIDDRGPGTAPATLIDYFPEDFLLVIDESHVTVPQIGGMYEGDMSRKRNLVEFGFRLPSAVDNRPLTWEEFADRIGQTVYLLATPSPWRAGPGQGRVRRTGDPAHRPVGPASRGKADKGPDRRPDPRDPPAHRARRARSGHHVDQEDVRGSHRLSPRSGHPGAIPAFRDRHPAPSGAAAPAAAGRV